MNDLTNIYSQNSAYKTLIRELNDIQNKANAEVKLNSLAGSSLAFIVANTYKDIKQSTFLCILPDKDSAAYFANDIEALFNETHLDYTKKTVLFYPATTKRPYSEDTLQNANIVLRLQTLNRINNGEKLIVVTYPEAISEKVTSKKQIRNNSTTITKEDEISIDNLIDILDEYNFQRVDFVTQSGEYAIRGGIIDIFSFSAQKPSRIEMSGDIVESIRTFDIVSQMSIEHIDKCVIVSNLQSENNIKNDAPISFLSYFDKDTIVWLKEKSIILQKVEEYFSLATKEYDAKINSYNNQVAHVPVLSVETIYSSNNEILTQLNGFNIIESSVFNENDSNDSNSALIHIEHSTQEQPSFQADFSLFADTLQQLTLEGYKNYFLVKDDKQQNRIEKIIEQYISQDKIINVNYVNINISQGFIDNEIKASFFTDHQLFNRYHKYTIQNSDNENEKLTLEDLITLKPGDYVVHIDHGIGQFAGLEKINNNGKTQETIRLLYKNNDILYVSIHALHKISRYSGKEGTEPKLNRLGSTAWQQLKQKTKKRVKDIAKDLIKLYAQRRASKGFQYSEDSYLQHELEASFMYEDTIDQYKATKAVKNDMEKPYPMDRLVCGDVGFGKTEVAIRAAFKAVCDSKQVAVLVPTTILAFQHYKTFSDRLKDMPCRIDYLNRFRSAKDKGAILKDLKEGKIDILIGTHKIVGKEVEFKDLGLLIIDEEQKFGVSMKEKLRQMKVNVDTLTLTATPIPRTLQFSLMGARDLSIINTPPANRQPVVTEISTFNQEVIRDAIIKELSRGGQVFFVHNRVQNIYEIANLLERLVPNARICVGHGQMEGSQLEKIMLDFINDEYDVLVCTTIVENGLDIPSANTIIINDAQNYGLSDLHQLRGRVGRSNLRAYCYLLVPSKEIMTEQAQKRLQAIEQFSSIGSGFAIAMRDLDIRGAGNILGAEQSGFISEVGYDMYNKILSEAILELKEDFSIENNDLPISTNAFNAQQSVLIETDLEILIPDYYITNVTERLKIYKELDSMTEEVEIENIIKELTDRFGKIPAPTMDLLEVVRIRRIASLLGIDKISLKRSKMTINFASSKISFVNDDNASQESKKFQNVLLFINQYPQHCQLKEDGNILQLTITHVQNIHQAKKILDRFNNI